ncbi:HD-domain/PDEase-like protein, partial [Aureobasidium melanogenum]
RTELSVPEEESEDSREDDIPPERDSLFGPSRTSQTQNEVQALKPDNARANAEPASPTSPARVRPTSASPLKSNKKKPSTSSFHAPYSVPFHQHSNSRRSSKDAALEQLEQLQLGQLSSFSRIENQNHDGARRGSGDASLTTILVRSQTAQSRQEPDSPTKPPPTPNRQTMRPLSPPAQPGVSSSVPSSRSHATSNATATTATCAHSPGSTRPSSVEETDGETPKGIQPPPVLSTENPFLHPNSSPDLHGRERISHSAPDIRNIPEVRTSKVSSVSHITADGDEGDDNRGMSQRPHGIRESRSRSRLRGLRFWRKRWKSPGPGTEVDTEP